MGAFPWPQGPLDRCKLGRFSPSAEGFRSPLPDDDVIDDLLRRVDEIVVEERETLRLRLILTDTELRPRYVQFVDDKIERSVVPDHDFYTEWLLGEVHRLANGVFYVDRLTAPGARWVAVATDGPKKTGPSLSAVLADIYRDLTGHEPPPRPTEEEVRAFANGLGWSPALGTQPAHVALANLQRAAASDDPRERLMARAVVEMGQAS